MPTAAVIVPAAGRGIRMGEGLAKQYRPLGDRPVLWHTLARLQACPRIGRIIVAIHADDEERFRQVAADPFFDKLQAPVGGGATRSDSVRAGLRALTDEELVLVHDAVRPWVSMDLIERVVEAAAEHGAAVPALPVTETIKVVEGIESSSRWTAAGSTGRRLRRDSVASSLNRPFNPPGRPRRRRTKPPCWSGPGSRCAW